MDFDGSNVDREEFLEGLQQFIDVKFTETDGDVLMRYFDTDQSGKFPSRVLPLFGEQWEPARLLFENSFYL